MIAFPEVICDLIAEYTCENKLLSWVDISKLDWYMLSKNPAIFSCNKKRNLYCFIISI